MASDRSKQTKQEIISAIYWVLNGSPVNLLTRGFLNCSFAAIVNQKKVYICIKPEMLKEKTCGFVAVSCGYGVKYDGKMG